MSASRSPSFVTIHCNHPPGCLAYVTGTQDDTETGIRAWLRGQGWTTGVVEGGLVADYCPPHPPAKEASQ